MSTKLVVFIRSVAFIVFAIVVGWNTSVLANDHRERFNSELNSGLVKAFNSVGQNLFGEAAFGASVVSVTDVDDMPAAVQIDISGLPADPDEPTPLTLINVFNSDTCDTVAQVLVGGGLDPEIITEREFFYDSLPKPCEEPGGDR